MFAVAALARQAGMPGHTPSNDLRALFGPASGFASYYFGYLKLQGRVGNWNLIRCCVLTLDEYLGLATERGRLDDQLQGWGASAVHSSYWMGAAPCWITGRSRAWADMGNRGRPIEAQP